MKRSNVMRGVRRAPGRFRRTQEHTLFVKLFETSADANLLVDAAGRIARANRRAVEMFAAQNQSLAGRALDTILREDQRERLRDELQALAERGPQGKDLPARQLDLVAVRSDSTQFPAEVTLTPLPPREKYAALCVVHDYSQRAERERRLRKGTELVQFLQDVAVAANEAESINSALQFSVNRMARLLGWPLGHAFVTEEDETLVATSIWAGTVPERFAVFKAVSEALRFRAGSGLVGWVLESGQPVWLTDLPDQERFVRRKEAAAAGLRTGLILPVLAGKRVIGVLEFYTPDIVAPDPNLLASLPHAGVQIGRVIERKRAENVLRQQTAQLRLVITSLPVIIWMVDRTGKLLMLEGKGLQDTQIRPCDMIGKNIFEQLQARPDMQELFRRSLKGEEVHEDVVSSTGLIFESFFVPYSDNNWNVEGVIGLSIDITKRKQLEAELDEMKHRLLESSDMERARLAQQLHDGPLQDLYGAFYQLQEANAGVEGPQKEMAGRALQTIQSANATLRMICGELHPNALVHLGLQRAIRGHAGRLQDRLDGTTLHLDLEDDSPASGSELAASLRLGLFRIYQQLVNNAARHARARHIWVRLKLLPGHVTLEVQDNGIGFQLPEHWIDLVRRNQYGLVSALERAQALGGTLEVRSHPGAGSLVRVVVPRA